MYSRLISFSILRMLMVTVPWVSLQALEPAEQSPADRLDSLTPSQPTEEAAGKPQWRLMGVVFVPDEKPRALLSNVENGNTLYIEEGAETQGWLVKDVQSNKVVLFNQERNEEWILRSYQDGTPARVKPARQVIQPEGISMEPSEETSADRLQKALTEGGAETGDKANAQENPDENAATRLQGTLDEDSTAEREDPLSDPAQGESPMTRLKKALERGLE